MISMYHIIIQKFPWYTIIRCNFDLYFLIENVSCQQFFEIEHSNIFWFGSFIVISRFQIFFILGTKIVQTKFYLFGSKIIISIWPVQIGIITTISIFLSHHHCQARHSGCWLTHWNIFFLKWQNRNTHNNNRLKLSTYQSWKIANAKT